MQSCCGNCYGCPDPWRSTLLTHTGPPTRELLPRSLSARALARATRTGRRQATKDARHGILACPPQSGSPDRRTGCFRHPAGRTTAIPWQQAKAPAGTPVHGAQAKSESAAADSRSCLWVLRAVHCVRKVRQQEKHTPHVLLRFCRCRTTLVGRSGCDDVNRGRREIHISWHRSLSLWRCRQHQFGTCSLPGQAQFFLAAGAAPFALLPRHPLPPGRRCRKI